jgi:tetratricopeptide (TPR) repeat protein
LKHSNLYSVLIKPLQTLKTAGYFALALLLTQIAPGAVTVEANGPGIRTFNAAIEQFLGDTGHGQDLDDWRRWLASASLDHSKGGHKTASSMLDRLRVGLFKIQGFSPDNSPDSRLKLENILPEKVVSNRRGHCIGLTAVGLALAEKLGFRAGLVRAPEHAFMRICDDSQCINMEMLEAGSSPTDAYYQARLSIPDDSIKKGHYLRTLFDPADLYASLMTAYGFAKVSAGDPAAGMEAYSRAIVQSPWAETLANRGATWFALGKVAEARADLDRATELNPFLPNAWLNKAVLEYKTQNFDQALRATDRALSLKPTLLQGHLIRGNIYLSRRKRAKAAAAFEDAIRIDPSSCPAILGLVRTQKSPPSSLKTKAVHCTQPQ